MARGRKPAESKVTQPVKKDARESSRKKKEDTESQSESVENITPIKSGKRGRPSHKEESPARSKSTSKAVKINTGKAVKVETKQKENITPKGKKHAEKNEKHRKVSSEEEVKPKEKKEKKEKREESPVPKKKKKHNSEKLPFLASGERQVKEAIIDLKGKASIDRIISHLEDDYSEVSNIIVHTMIADLERRGAIIENKGIYTVHKDEIPHDEPVKKPSVKKASIVKQPEETKEGTHEDEKIDEEHTAEQPAETLVEEELIHHDEGENNIVEEVHHDEGKKSQGKRSSKKSVEDEGKKTAGRKSVQKIEQIIQEEDPKRSSRKSAKKSSMKSASKEEKDEQVFDVIANSEDKPVEDIENEHRAD